MVITLTQHQPQRTDLKDTRPELAAPASPLRPLFRSDGRPQLTQCYRVRLPRLRGQRAAGHPGGPRAAHRSPAQLRPARDAVLVRHSRHLRRCLLYSPLSLMWHILSLARLPITVCRHCRAQYSICCRGMKALHHSLSGFSSAASNLVAWTTCLGRTSHSL